MPGSSSAASKSGLKWLAQMTIGEGDPADDGMADGAHHARVEDGQDATLADLGRGCPQEERDGRPQQQQWRTDHGQQEVLDHVHAEERRRIDVDEREERDGDDRQPAQPGGDPSAWHRARRMGTIDLPDAGQVEPGGDDDAHKGQGLDRPGADHDPGRRRRRNDVRDVPQRDAGQGRQGHRGEAAAAQQPRGVTDERAHQPV